MVGMFGNVGSSPFLTTSLYRSISSGYSSFVSPNRSKSLFSLSGFGVNLASASGNAKQSLVELKNYSTQLKDAANQLVAGFPPLMEQMVAAIEENDKALDVKNVDGNRQQRGKSYTVEVESLAKAQRNTGAPVAANTQVVSAGSYNLNINGKSLRLNVSEDDDAKSLQDKLAGAINKGSFDVSARVETQNGESRLILEGKETGAKNAFTVTDTEGNLGAALGIHNVETEARDAAYSVNGVRKSSAKNDVSLARGLDVTLRAETGGRSAKLRVQADEKNIAPAVRSLVDGFNNLLQTVGNVGNAASDTAAGRLVGAYQANAAVLEQAGIAADENGVLQIDEKRLSAAMQDGTLQKALDGGFAAQVERVANNVSKNPIGYAVPQMSPASSFPTYGSGSFADTGSWDVSAYTPHFQNIGVLFESLI